MFATFPGEVGLSSFKSRGDPDDAAFYGILFGSSLFTKVPVKGFQVNKG